MRWKDHARPMRWRVATGLVVVLGAGACTSPDDSTPFEPEPLALALVVAELDEVTAGRPVRLGAVPVGGAGELRLAWRQTAGPKVELQDFVSMHPSLVAPQVTERTELVFEVTATDRSGHLVSREVSFFVDPADLEAFAGPVQRVYQGQTVSLNGRVTGPATLDSIAWRQTSGPPVVLDDPSRLDPIFEAPTADAPLDLAFELEVMSTAGKTVTTKTGVAVAPRWTGVWAGPNLNAHEGDTFIIDAHVFGDLVPPISYEWSALSGAAVFETPDALESKVTLGAPSTDGSWRLSFELADGANKRITDERFVGALSDTTALSVTILSSLGDVPPGVAFRYFASPSGGSGAYTYEWDDVNSPVSISFPNSSNPIIHVPSSATGNVSLSVWVSDGTDSAVDSSFFGIAPIAATLDAGVDKTVHAGDRVYLNPTSTGDGATPDVIWEKLGGPTFPLEASNTPNPFFYAPDVTTDQTIRFLAERDGLTDTVDITVLTASPVPSISGPRSVVSGQRATLGAILDPATPSTSFEWIQYDGPPVTFVSSTDQAEVQFIAPATVDDAIIKIGVIARSSFGKPEVTVLDLPVEGRPTVTFPEPLPEVAVPVQDRRLHVCSDATNCTASQALATCPAEAPYGLNEIVMPADGSYQIHKRCGAPDECRARWWGETRRNADCVQLAGATDDLSALAERDTIVVCTYCCTGEGCNAPTIPVSDTLLECDDDGCR